MFILIECVNQFIVYYESIHLVKKRFFLNVGLRISKIQNLKQDP